MKHFKNTSGEVSGFESVEEMQQFCSSNGLAEMIELTPEEFELHKNPPKTAEQEKELLRQQYKRGRDAALMSITYTFADGRVIQVRPIDLPYFNEAIADNVDTNWIMEDNKPRLTTVAELVEAKDAGKVKARTIWEEYATKLSLL